MSSRPLGQSNKRDNNSTPPPDGRGQKDKKNLHSPWSAQRDRKRPAIKCDPAPLAIIDEDYTSPPKRRNGGTSPAARELRLSAAGLVLDESLEAAGPLAQGLLLQSGAGCSSGFSPLASGIVRASFTFTAGVSTLAQASLAPHEGTVPEQDVAVAAAVALPAAGTAVAAAAAGPAGQPRGSTLSFGDSEAAGGLVLAECSYGALSRSWTAPLPDLGMDHSGQHHHAHHEHARPMSQLTDRSRRSHGEMDLDLRSSWGSDRSADVLPWRAMQARLHEEFALVQSARRRSHDPHSGGGGCAGQHFDAMRASVESLRDSLELPSCMERQGSLVPLRTSIRGHWQQSHLASPSPAADAKLHRLPITQSPIVRPLGSGQKQHRGTCFMCPSPFCKSKRPTDDEAEVVRRVESEEFVLHRTDSLDNTELPRERASLSKPRRESLNRPPSPAELVHRQGGFSAKCCSTPVHLLSPQSAYSDDDHCCHRHSPVVEQAPSSQELLACLTDQSKNPTIDELNDMLRTFCTLDFHPKDAEELVTEVSKTFQLAPNATTLRTLDKIWAAHDQMYG